MTYPARARGSRASAHGRPLRRSRRPRGSSTLELIAVFTIIGIILSAAVGQYLPTHRDVLDRAGPVLIAAAVLDARAVASTNHYTYPADAQGIADALNAIAPSHATGTLNATYTTGAAALIDADSGKGTIELSVAAGTPTTLGLAVMTSAAGPDAGKCLLAVDSLRTGTVYAQMTGVALGSSQCSGVTAIACAPQWGGSPAAGTYTDPHAQPVSDACVATDG